jgi:hypothetical protein
MQPKIQKRINKATLKQELAPPAAIEPTKPIVEAFDPNQIQQLEILREQNNLYGSLRIQEEDTKKQIKGIQAVIHKIRSGEIKMDELFVPFGMGNQRRLHDRHKTEYLDTYMKQLQMEQNKLDALSGQRLHRADEVGEQRLKVLRMLWTILRTQHQFTDEELCNHCSEYVKARENPTELQMLTPLASVQETIRKAGAIDV